MTTLTSDQITDIRLVTGADESSIISDSVIQTQYDNASTDAPDSTYVLPYTYVYILRRLLGHQRTKGNRTTDFGDNETRNDVTENTRSLLRDWERQAGLEGRGILAAGAISLELDYDQEDLDAGL